MGNSEEFYTARGYEIAAGEDALTPSMEDYIEMIYRLSQGTGYTRVNDLAEKLNVQPPSVTKMMQRLHDRSLLNYERYGMIHLTEEGKALGNYFLQRHNTLKKFLSLLGIVKNLQKNVEQMEHYINWDTFQVIDAFVSFLQQNPEILKQFKQFRERSV
ncbi:transcriptional regulator MntR [Desulfofalx alkaliphila]|uniref:transcriptional regulator MntR n=1 Tax=Desulfofalx alkaliphila TaxID=105483 RepID=UPI0004E18391|nr:transcriptional regulator MntR [Desulfofalx alkaliphila]